MAPLDARTAAVLDRGIRRPNRDRPQGFFNAGSREVSRRRLSSRSLLPRAPAQDRIRPGATLAFFGAAPPAGFRWLLPPGPAGSGTGVGPRGQPEANCR